MPDLIQRDTYDGVTIAFHWATALLVFALVGTSFSWLYLPRAWHLDSLQGVHISLGILLALVVIGRILWRLVAGRRLEPASPADLLSKLVHMALYLLIAAQVTLGFCLRWLQGEEFQFFGLFDIPRLLAPNHGLAEQLEDVHGLFAWAILIVVAGHTAAALFHRYVLKDGVLRRMLPIAR